MNNLLIPSDQGKESWGALAVAAFLCQGLNSATVTQFYALLLAIVVLTLAAGIGRIYMKRLQLMNGEKGDVEEGGESKEYIAETPSGNPVQPTS